MISIGGSRGRAGRTPPYGTQFFHFRQKAPVSEVHAPLRQILDPPLVSQMISLMLVLRRHKLYKFQKMAEHRYCPNTGELTMFCFIDAKLTAHLRQTLMKETRSMSPTSGGSTSVQLMTLQVFPKPACHFVETSLRCLLSPGDICQFTAVHPFLETCRIIII